MNPSQHTPQVQALMDHQSEWKSQGAKTNLPESGLNVPPDKCLYIPTDIRQKVFVNMIENYQIFCPDLTMQYGALGWDSSLGIDYLVIFTTKVNGNKIILWDSPYAFTNRGTAAYWYVIQTSQHEAFFKECRIHMKEIKRKEFNDYLKSSYCNSLSLNPISARYWKRPENYLDLFRGMSDISLVHTPRGFKNHGVLQTNIPSQLEYDHMSQSS